MGSPTSIEASPPLLFSSSDIAELLGATAVHINRLADAGILPVAALLGPNRTRCFDATTAKAALAAAQLDHPGETQP